MRLVSPKTELFLKGDQGRELTAMVGIDGARLYWHGRQALPLTAASVFIGTLFAMLTIPWLRMPAVWIVIIWFASTTLPLVIYGIAMSWVLTWRTSKAYGVPFHRSLNIPFDHPERLPGWARSHDAKVVPPLAPVVDAPVSG